MNNKERLLNSNINEMADEIRHLFIENPASKYIDIEKWLSSSSLEPIYQGNPKLINDKEYIVVGTEKIYGKDYIKVIDPQLSLVKFIEGVI